MLDLFIKKCYNNNVNKKGNNITCLTKKMLKINKKVLTS